MDKQLNDLILDLKKSIFQKNDFLNKYLYNRSFRGFWFDSGEKSYGIVLSFEENQTSALNLYAKDMDGQMIVIKYLIKSDSFSIEPIANDKVQITITEFNTKLLFPRIGGVQVPDSIEFTLQILSHNSVYIQFLNYRLFSSPIDKLRFGLVLARESR